MFKINENKENDKINCIFFREGLFVTNICEYFDKITAFDCKVDLV